MSFRTRLGLFFLLIVVIPIALIAVLVVNVTAESEDGKADAQLSVGLTTAVAVQDRAIEDATASVQGLLGTTAVADALTSGSNAQIERVLGDRAEAAGLVSLVVDTPDGDELTVLGDSAPIAAATVTTQGGGEGEFSLVGSTIDPETFANQVERLTGLQTVLVGPDGESIGPIEAADVPEPGASTDVVLDDEEVRAASAALRGNTGRVTLLAPVSSGGFLGSQSRIAFVAGLFLLLALLGVLLISRVLQSQISRMLEAAKRIGEGDFSRRVPVVGRDEMAGLAGEFNKMSERLEEQIIQLRRQRTELDRSITRLGEAFASGLDRNALLKIVAETALAACDGAYARVSIDGELIEVPGRMKGHARDAAVAGQKRAEREGTRVDARRGNGVALAAPLRTITGKPILGALAVGRIGKPFDASERDVFLYLIGQASASIENIAQHEEASAQAVTDDLTGLPNNRSFRETIEREASRAERFGHELSLLVLDIDDFKKVNDTHGHLQGDEVLKALGVLLQEEPRAVDNPARYGGEEFVVALPETGPAGAMELADRIRERLEGTAIPLRDGSGELRVTASVGVATMPRDAANVTGLFSAADEALYEAKRSGKNRSIAAPETVRLRQ